VIEEQRKEDTVDVVEGGAKTVGEKINLKNLIKDLVSGEKEFEDCLYQHLNTLDEAYKDKVDITRYPIATAEFVEFISFNYSRFKVFADEKTKAQFYEILDIENSFAFGFYKLAASSTDNLMKFCYIIAFLVWLGIELSYLFFWNTQGLILFCSLGGSLSIFYLVYIIRHRMWVSYLSFGESIKFYFSCKCCLKPKIKVKLN
jgi:hypothetical protein